MRSVYEYRDYRSYLRDFYQEQKRVTRNFTVRQFSERAGIRSPNYLSLIMNGDRQLSRDYATRFSRALEHTDDERSYWHTLVSFNQASDSKDKEALGKRLQQLSSRGQVAVLQTAVQQFLEDWIRPVVREMVSLSHFQPDAEWIARRLMFPVEPERIKKALAFLLESGFIRRKGRRYQITEPNLSSTDEIPSKSVRLHHKLWIKLAMDAIDDQPVAEREYGALTLMLPKELVAEFKADLKAFRRQLHQKYAGHQRHVHHGDVYQMNFQFFRLTKGY